MILVSFLEVEIIFLFQLLNGLSDLALAVVRKWHVLDHLVLEVSLAADWQAGPESLGNVVVSLTDDTH